MGSFFNMHPLVVLYQRSDSNLTFSHRQKVNGKNGLQARAYGGNLMVSAFARLSRHLHNYFDFPFEMSDETKIKFIILSRKLTTFESVFTLAFRLLERSLPILSEWRFNVCSGTAAAHLPTGGKCLGNASFTNAAGSHYRALAFALPAPVAGGYRVYLRLDCDYHWIMFEDESALKLIAIPHDLVANLIPSVAVYKKIL